MKKFLALAAIAALVACEKKADTPPAADSSAMMAPDSMTPRDSTMRDSGMQMMHDSMAMPRDTTKGM
jgi:hypothetical protein